MGALPSGLQRWPGLLGAVIALATAIAGCHVITEDSTLELGVAEHSFGPAGFAGLSVEIEEAGRVRRVTSVDFRPTESNRSPHTRAFEVGERGTLYVRGVLVEAGDTVARGEIAISLRPDTRWSVDFQRSIQDPMFECFGCLESRRFDIPPNRQRMAGEAFWIVVSGRKASERDMMY